VAKDKKITVVRFDVKMASGLSTTARIVAHTEFVGGESFAVSASANDTPELRKLVGGAIKALAAKWPGVPNKVEIRVNQDGEITEFIFS